MRHCCSENILEVRQEAEGEEQYRVLRSSHGMEEDSIRDLNAMAEGQEEAENRQSC